MVQYLKGALSLLVAAGVFFCGVIAKAGACNTAPCGSQDTYEINNVFGSCDVTVDIVWLPLKFCTIDVPMGSSVTVCIPDGTTAIFAVLIEGVAYSVPYPVGPSLSPPCPASLVNINQIGGLASGIGIL